MNKLYEKNELMFSFAWIIAYVVLFSFAENLSETLGIPKIITAPFSVSLALILFIWIRKNDLSEKYGLCSFKGRFRDYLYFIPLLPILTVNLWNGIGMTHSAAEIVLHILSMICVGFIEEVLFRGFLFKALCKGNIKQAVLISSLTFGIGHIVNLLNGEELFSTLSQVCYATAIGFVLTVIFLKGKSLLPCIFTHGVINSLNIFYIEGSQTFLIIVTVILTVSSVAYALFLLKKFGGIEPHNINGI